MTKEKEVSFWKPVVDFFQKVWNWLSNPFRKNKAKKLANEEEFKSEKIADITLGRVIYPEVASIIREAEVDATKDPVTVKMVPKSKNDTSTHRILELCKPCVNILSVQKLHCTKDYAFFVFERFKGAQSLVQVIQEGDLDPWTVKVIFKQLVIAMLFMKSRAIVHRDIKADNLLVNHKNEAKLIDFDYSVECRATGGKLHGIFPCTPLYASPDRITGKVYDGFASDLWSAGITLYYALTGNLPFLSKREICGKRYPRSAMIPSPAVCLLNMMLQKDPSKRATIEQVANHPWLN